MMGSSVHRLCVELPRHFHSFVCTKVLGMRKVMDMLWHFAREHAGRLRGFMGFGRWIVQSTATTQRRALVCAEASIVAV